MYGYGRDELDDIDALIENAEAEKLRAVSYRTVDMFAGITRKKLWLRDTSKGEKRASTNGHAISVPFDDPNSYTLIEHEISHVLFRSDAVAKNKFVQEYADRAASVSSKNGVSISPDRISPVMDGLISILEDHRVKVLWGMLYPGSYQMMIRIDRETGEILYNEARVSLLAYFATMALGVETPSNEKFRRFDNLFREALRKVERRGFAATLLVAKWLITNLVSELLRESQNLPPANPGMTPQFTTPDTIDSLMAEFMSSRDGNSSSQNEGGEGDQDESSGGGDQSSESSEDGESKSSSSNEAGWLPPQADGDAKARAVHLEKLMAMMGARGMSRNAENSFSKLNDFEIPEGFVSRDQQKAAEKLTALALRTDASDRDKMDAMLTETREQMDKILEDAKAAMKRALREDTWLTKGAMAKVQFLDISGDPSVRKPQLSHYDTDTVRKLRQRFMRVMGQKRSTLEEDGFEVDVASMIQHRVTGLPMPCFKHDVRGRGFKAMILIDRSGSMNGTKTRDAERACRIITKALKLPFVDVAVWGFTSQNPGEVILHRYDMKSDGMHGAPVGGSTPIHVALRVAARWMGQGDESKQLFLLTDGMPVFQRRDGDSFSTSQLMLFTRQEANEARRNGVNVTCAMIGDDVSDKHLTFMFGHSKNWRKLDERTFGKDLVDLVSSSFTDYLKTT